MIDFVIDVNLRGVMHNFHDAMNYLKGRKTPNKTIIFTSSIAGSLNAKVFKAFGTGIMSYSATKVVTNTAPN